MGLKSDSTREFIEIKSIILVSFEYAQSREILWPRDKEAGNQVSQYLRALETPESIKERFVPQKRTFSISLLSAHLGYATVTSSVRRARQVASCFPFSNK
jgi:hypothetical protein